MHEGFTERDYFASSALQGLLASGKYSMVDKSGNNISPNDLVQTLAKLAYVFADAMSEVREKGGEAKAIRDAAPRKKR
jgi:hypothetical protein